MDLIEALKLVANSRFNVFYVRLYPGQTEQMHSTQ